MSAAAAAAAVARPLACAATAAALAISTSPSDSQAQCEPRAELLQAHIIFRHGARTPVFWDPALGIDTSAFKGKCMDVNSPPGVAGPHAVPFAYKSGNLQLSGLDGTSKRPHSVVDSAQLKPVYEECRVGQLTSLGAEQSAELGRTLRARYAELANAARAEDKIYIRTSNVARCVATLQFVLGELFPNDRGVFAGKTAKAKEEYLYPNPTHCKLTSYLMHTAKQEWERTREADEHAKQVVHALREAIPPPAFDALKIAPGYNFVRVRDYLVAYRAHGLPAPWSALDEDVARKVEELGSEQVAAFIHHDRGELSKLSARTGVGGILQIISNAMLAQKQTQHTFSLISAHDTTLMPILSAMEVWDGKTWPDFCAWIAFELYSTGAVHVLFNGRVVREFPTLAEFQTFMRGILPDAKRTWKESCDPAAAVGEHGALLLPDITATTSQGDTW